MGIRHGVTRDQHDSLVRAIYDGVTSDDLLPMIAQWPDAFGSWASHLMVIDPRSGVLESRHHGAVRGDPERYEEHFIDRDPRVEISRQHLGSVISDVSKIDRTQFERSEVYNEILRPYRVRYSLFGYAPLANGLLMAQALMRGPSAEYDQRDVDAMQRLWPHLQRGLDLRFELRDLRRRVAGFSAALDHVLSPLFLIDAQQRVVYHNAAAQIVLAAGSLRVNRQQLTAPTPAATAAVRAAIARASTFADAVAGGDAEPPTSSLRVERAIGSALQLVVYPLRPTARDQLALPHEIRALVVVHDPDAKARVDADLVARLHGLTPTEAALAAMLAEGHSLAEFAIKRGCTEATARTHLKRVLDKMGVNRQAELVQKILLGTALQLS